MHSVQNPLVFHSQTVKLLSERRKYSLPAPLMAAKQRLTHFFLKSFDPAAQGWLTDIQVIGSFSHIAVTADSQESSYFSFSYQTPP